MTGLSQESPESIVGTAVKFSPLSIVLTDPRIEDEPITYVNDAFVRTTQYSRQSAVGRNCRFLQGEDTDPDDVRRLREGLKSGEQFEVTLLNYKADGTPFMNQLLISPVHDESGAMIARFGLQREVDRDLARAASENTVRHRDSAVSMLRELQHRVKNHLAMVVSMIRMQARREVTTDSFQALSRRIEALALLYDELFKLNVNVERDSRIQVDGYLKRISEVLSGIDGRGTVKVRVTSDPIVMSVDQAARVGLLLSELVTNAMEHAFEARDSGSIHVSLEDLGQDRLRLEVIDDGIGLPEGSNWPHGADSLAKQRRKAEGDNGKLDTTGANHQPGVGGSIVVSLARSLDAELAINSTGEGTRVSLDFTRET